MKTQVITIAPDGSLVGLDHKKKGLDLRQFGRAEIKRVTLIEWSETQQQWFIRWDESRVLWKAREFVEAGVEFTAFNGVACAHQLEEGVEPLILFNDYDDAVAAEVAVIQALQLKGEEVHT